MLRPSRSRPPNLIFKPLRGPTHGRPMSGLPDNEPGAPLQNVGGGNPADGATVADAIMGGGRLARTQRPDVVNIGKHSSSDRLHHPTAGLCRWRPRRRGGSDTRRRIGPATTLRVGETLGISGPATAFWIRSRRTPAAPAATTPPPSRAGGTPTPTAIRVGSG